MAEISQLLSQYEVRCAPYKVSYTCSSSIVLQAKHCAGGMKNSLLQNEQIPKAVLQCLNDQLDTEIVCVSSFVCMIDYTLY